MIYFSVKTDLDFIRAYRETFTQMRSIENEVKAKSQNLRKNYITARGWHEDMIKKAQEIEEYKTVREKYTMGLRRTISIADRHRVPHRIKIQSAPLEGNHYFDGSHFEAILHPPSLLADLDTPIYDTLNQILGVLERNTVEEFHKLINPLFWLQQTFTWMIRLPFTVMKMSGFNVDVIQQHFWGKFCQLVYIVVLLIILLKLGVDIASIKFGV